MKNFYKGKLWLLLCLVSSLGFLTSCDDESEGLINNGEVSLLSFGPTGAKHGETLKFIGFNLDKVETIQLPNATIAKAQFKSQSSELIELVIPVTATAGKVMLKTSAGTDIESKTVLSFEVPVTIASITGEARPGSDITINGNFLNWVRGVKFGTLTDTVKTFVSQSMTQVVVRVPDAAKTGKLTIFTGGTEPLIIESTNDLVVTLPKVTAIAPASLKHGENLTLTGTDLDLVSTVRFKGVGAANVTSFVSKTPTQLVVTVPDNATAGSLMLIAANSMVEVPLTQSVTIVLPAITALSPSPIDAEANLTITGTNLDLVKTVTFTGGKATSTFISKTPTQIMVKVPAGALKGALNLTTIRNFEVITTAPILEFKGSLPPLAPLAFAFFDDARKANWGDWGYGGTRVWDATDIVRMGTTAAKMTFTGDYGAFRFHAEGTGNEVNAANYTEMTFSIFGTPGTGGKSINLVFNEAYGTPAKTITIVEGEWTTYTFSRSALGNPTMISDVLFQGTTWRGTIYLDHMGFR